MNSTGTFQDEHKDKRASQSGENDLVVILSLIRDNWYYLVIAFVAAFVCALLYIGHTMPVYRTSAIILINETEDRPLVENFELMQGLGLPGGMRNLQNQITILKSRELTEKTLNELPFELEFYFKTVINKLPVYPETPLAIIADGEIPLPNDTEFCITFLANNMFNVESMSDYFILNETAAFGEDIITPLGRFQIEARNENWISIHKERKLYFIVHSPTHLINYFTKRIDVSLVSREGSILSINLVGTNRAKDMDFLNEQISNFQDISLDKKNIEAERRIQFIDDQLVGISDSLSTTESRLQQFRSTHRVMDLSAQGQAIIGQVTLLDNERARLNLEANYYDYLADYLNKESSEEMPIIPITMGINDAGLTRLVEELAELQGQLATAGAGEMNPLQRNMEQRVRATKDALRETLNGLRRANSLARSENQEQLNSANSQASSLPVTERQLLGIERKFKLNDELYTFLLETRAEQQMQKASNRADSEVIDSADARFSTLISPQPVKIYALGFLSALALTFLFIYLKFVLNKKLKDEDIAKMTDLPIVGSIPHYTEKSNLIVFNYPDSILAEAFRLLRSRMQFFTKEAKAPVILVTSSIPGEGKTLTAINLASVYSLLDKKTILVGFDLRKPKIYDDFNLNNEKGVSTWLIGRDKLQDVIQETSYKNLSVISSGPIPPNPSELIALEKTEQLLRLLKEKYDYVIIDTPPIGVVSDTFHLTSLADACLLVLRPGYTVKSMLELTLNEINGSGMKGISLVLNDIQSDSKHYGYRNKYSYGHNKENLIKRALKRN